MTNSSIRLLAIGVLIVCTTTERLIAAPASGQQQQQQQQGESTDLVSYENVPTENGYRFSYETVDGQKREEEGVFDAQSGVLRVSGWYSFRAPDGAVYRVDYVADENGYRTMAGEPMPPAVVTQILPVPVAAAPLSNAALLSLVG